jgi:hypothetical protein
MDWRTIKEIRFELEFRGYFVESMTDKFIVVSLLKDENKKLFYVYPGVYDGEGKHKVFDLNLKEM